ncbi:MAG TPA: chloride channel protein [Gemmatimonadaceae bacterium]|nr:chloride channel protein [Gemmatimonadaceae bacterium]
MTPDKPTAALVPREYQPVDRRTVFIAALALVIALFAGLAAQFLTALIGLVTNLVYHNRVSTEFVSPMGSPHGPFLLLLVPVVGALLIGLIARFGSTAIRGHGIPEVMEKVLYGGSRISARVMVFKPLSAAIAIGTGGPFGAEGPIIATGGALGSLVGQHVKITDDERKTLLAAGAAAGMAATFGTPVSATLLAVELLLFEYRPRSLIPVALAAALATAVRVGFVGTAPVFGMAQVSQPTNPALASYAALGVIIGVIAVLITKSSVGIEEAFERFGERFGIHWMWWPAIGAVVVGVVGIIEPRTLGVGYENITGALQGTLAGRALIMLVALKFISWAVYLGSGTSGGTLAPLFTIGSGIGAWIGSAVSRWMPGLGVDPHVAALVGMAAIFAGASHALLASVVFAFETTRQPLGLLPLLAGCTAAYLTALMLDRHSIMTKKLALRGSGVRTEYSTDHLSQIFVREVATRDVVSIRADATIEATRAWLAGGNQSGSHQGFPVLAPDGRLLGVVTRRDLNDPRWEGTQYVGQVVRRAPVIVFEDSTLRDAADQMTREHVGRLPVVARDQPWTVTGFISRSDLLTAHAPRLAAAHRRQRLRRIGRRKRGD